MSDIEYSAVIRAASKLACSPIVDRNVRERAQTYLDDEIARWSEAGEFDPETPERDDDDDESAAERDKDLVYAGPTNADRVADGGQG